MARPLKYSPQRVEAILGALRLGNTRAAAAAYAGVDDETLRRWMPRFPEFRAAVVKAEADAEVRAVAEIRQAYQAGNWTAAAWWLERRRPQDWGRKDRVDVVQIVREMAAREGFSQEDADEAAVEAQRFLKELNGARPR